MKNIYSILLYACLICATTLTVHAQSGTTGELSWSISEGMLTIWVTNGGVATMPDNFCGNFYFSVYNSKKTSTFAKKVHNGNT